MSDPTAHAQEIVAGRNATVIFLESGKLLQGSFYEVERECVRFAPLEPPKDELEPFSGCVVIYSVGQQACVFLSHLIAQFEQDGLPLLELGRPDAVHRTDRRVVFRVPLLPGHELATHVMRDGEQESPAEPLDISFVGIRLGAELDPPLSRADRVHVRLACRGTELTLPGTVKNVHGGDAGILFAHAAEGQVAAPEALKSIVMDMQRHWLRNRAS